jgi:hypothetical protein
MMSGKPGLSAEARADWDVDTTANMRNSKPATINRGDFFTIILLFTYLGQ